MSLYYQVPNIPEALSRRIKKWNDLIERDCMLDLPAVAGTVDVNVNQNGNISFTKPTLILNFQFMLLSRNAGIYVPTLPAEFCAIQILKDQAGTAFFPSQINPLSSLFIVPPCNKLNILVIPSEITNYVTMNMDVLKIVPRLDNVNFRIMRNNTVNDFRLFVKCYAVEGEFDE